jgi:hypothetical protein
MGFLWPACWDTIQIDVMRFQWGTLNVARINQAAVCLIPKTRNPQKVKEYRPISLINCVFQIITKVLANRLTG